MFSTRWFPIRPLETFKYRCRTCWRSYNFWTDSDVNKKGNVELDLSSTHFEKRSGREGTYANLIYKESSRESPQDILVCYNLFENWRCNSQTYYFAHYFLLWNESSVHVLKLTFLWFNVLWIRLHTKGIKNYCRKNLNFIIPLTMLLTDTKVPCSIICSTTFLTKQIHLQWIKTDN